MDHIFWKNLTANCSKTAYELFQGPCSFLQFSDCRILCFFLKTSVIPFWTLLFCFVFFFLFSISFLPSPPFPPPLKKQRCLPVSCSHLSALLTCAWNLWQPHQNCSELFIVEKVEKKNTQTNNLIKQRKAISGKLNSLFLYWIVLNSWNWRIALCFLFCCPLRLS